MPRTAITSPRHLVRDFGTCLNFTGGSSTNNVTYTVPSSMSNMAQFTVAIWCFPTNIDSTPRRLFNDGTTIADGKGFDIWIRTVTDGLTGAVAYDTQDYLKRFNHTDLKLHKWQRVLMTWNDTGQDLKMYINTTELSPISTQSSVGSRQSWTGTTAYIGNAVTNNRSWEGRLDEVCVWSRILTTDEISQDFYRGPPLSGLTFYYKFDEGSGTSATDSSGNSVTGTISGATYSTSVAMKPRTVATSRTLVQ